MRRTRRRPGQGATNVDVTAFLSLMVILVPFLLITAVFSRMTILELEAASSEREPGPREDPLQLRVLVRDAVIEVSYRGQEAPIRLARTPGDEAQRRLADLVVGLKGRFPEVSSATILLEPQIPYEDLVQVMDAVRVRRQGTGEEAEFVALFPQLALGETPAVAQTGREGK